jgi:hypothetical protein
VFNAIADNWPTLLALGVCWAAWWRSRRAEARLGELAEAVAPLLRRDCHGRTLLSRIEALMMGVDMADEVHEAGRAEGVVPLSAADARLMMAADQLGRPLTDAEVDEICRGKVVPLKGMPPGRVKPDGFDESDLN